MNVWMMCVTVLLSAWTLMVGLSAHVTQDTRETDSTALVIGTMFLVNGAFDALSVSA